MPGRRRGLRQEGQHSAGARVGYRKHRRPDDERVGGRMVRTDQRRAGPGRIGDVERADRDRCITPRQASQAANQSHFTHPEAAVRDLVDDQWCDRRFHERRQHVLTRKCLEERLIEDVGIRIRLRTHLLEPRFGGGLRDGREPRRVFVGCRRTNVHVGARVTETAGAHRESIPARRHTAEDRDVAGLANVRLQRERRRIGRRELDEGLRHQAQ